MGTSYDNITLKGASQEAIVSFLGQIGIVAYVSPPAGDITVVYCSRNDGGIARRLSQHLHCIALFASVFDSDVFSYELYENGVLNDQYESFPGTFYDMAETRFPFDEHAKKICTAFGVPEAQEQIAAILLGYTWQSGRQWIFRAQDQHDAFRKALGLPPWAGHTTYDHIQSNREWSRPADQHYWSEFIETKPPKPS
jgi:hypothetical protein